MRWSPFRSFQHLLYFSLAHASFLKLLGKNRPSARYPWIDSSCFNLILVTESLCTSRKIVLNGLKIIGLNTLSILSSVNNLVLMKRIRGASPEGYLAAR